MNKRRKCVFNERTCRDCGCMHLTDETDAILIEEGIKMRRVTIDENACVGCGLCVTAVPHVFELGKDGLAKIKIQDHMDIELKLEAAEDCPVSAITVDD